MYAWVLDETEEERTRKFILLKHKFNNSLLFVQSHIKKKNLLDKVIASTMYNTL